MSVLEKISTADNIKIRDLLEKMDSSENGLSDSEVQRRIVQYGYNEIVNNNKNPFVKSFSYFWGPIPIMIEIASILSLIVHNYTDFGIIFALLLVNAFVGYWHDRKSGNAVEMLKKKLYLTANVLRNDVFRTIHAREIVPGDIVRIRPGDIIPADVTLIDGEYLECDESSLTGESMPVSKKILQEAYSGSIVIRGEMTAVVSATGTKTFFGNTDKFSEEAENKSSYEKAIIKIGNYLIVLAALLVMVIFIYALFRHDNVMETLRFVMVLTVASIPVALPAILTVTMAFGAVHLAKKNAVVRRLAAIEGLACVDVLCTDKTGTLTTGILTAGKPIPTFGHIKSDVLMYGALCSRHNEGSAIDKAILDNIQSDQSLQAKIEDYSTSNYFLFDPVKKRTEVTVSKENKKFIVSKGEPQVIFNLIKDKHSIENYEKVVEEYAQLGYSNIAVALKEEKGDWELIGLIPLFDPLREESAEAIKEAKTLGVDVKIVTGDSVAISRQISQKLGMTSNILPAEKLKNIPAHELEEYVEKSDGFAEMFPEHKFTIVKILQQLKHLVGLIGDGVNDAPALKKADCGIAVNTAADAAKSAASIVLTVPGISVIIDAIKEGRKIFQRMNSYAIYRIAETIRVLFFITLSILVFNFYPVTALMIVLLALLNDVPMIAISTDNVRNSYNPGQWKIKNVMGLGAILGTVGVVSTFLIFYLGKELLKLDIQTLQSFIFLKLAIAGHLTIFISRTRKSFWSAKPSPTLLWSALISKIIATLLTVYGVLISPIGWKLAVFVWLYAIAAFFITDRIKIFYYNSFFTSLRTA